MHSAFADTPNHETPSLSPPYNHSFTERPFATHCTHSFATHCSRLPEDIVINHIMPFIYNTQSPLLLQDIQDFTENQNILTHLTKTDNELFRHILKFCHKHSIYIINLLSRSFHFRQKTNPDKIQCVNNHFHIFNAFKKDIKRKLKCLIGLLTPVERMKLVNKILIY